MRLLVSLFIIIITACGQPINPLKKIEGEWRAGGDDGDGHSWYLTYTFKDDNYKMQGYPPIAESGKMVCKGVKGDSLFIEFKVDKASPNGSSHSAWILVKGNMMVLNSMNFTKTSIENK